MISKSNLEPHVTFIPKKSLMDYNQDMGLFNNTFKIRSSLSNDPDLQKKQFLDSLKSKTLPYKRYTGSPLRYGGGKSLAVGLIIENYPRDIERLISPFIGGGSVEIATALELGIKVKAFDIFDILVNFWNVLINNPNDLYHALLKLKPNKVVYTKIKDELNDYWNFRHKNPNSQPKVKLDSITLARDYFFNFNLSYGPGFLGWISKVYEDERKYHKMLEKIKNVGNHSNIKKLSVKQRSFEEVFKLYTNDFFYCDPPYYLDEDSKMFKGIYPMRNFPIHHNGFNHKLLAECLLNHKGKFILSYNDCEFVRETYKDFKILEPKWQYTMGQGETRIGKNRINRGNKTNIKDSHELLIIKE